MNNLDELLTRAMEADQADRINLRDPIAAHGETAIEAMSDWINDYRLAAFAIRVLERIGNQQQDRQAAIAVLAAVDRSELPPHLIGDLDRALAALGSPVQIARQRNQPATGGSRPAGMPGRPGRGYWVMRTSQWERPYLWSEAHAGRLRQGWGVADEQDLAVIEATLRRGGNLSGLQQEARRALRMLASWDHGMQLGDIVVAPNLPEYGRLSIFQVTGPYEWSPSPAHRFGERFGHVLPVELMRSDLTRWSPEVSDGLRSVLGVQTRLYNVSGYGGDVERLIGGSSPSDRRDETWTEAEYESLFGRFPPEGTRPTDLEVDAIAIEFGRTPDAISWQWNDGAAYCQGRSASTTSEVLKAWLDDRGLRR